MKKEERGKEKEERRKKEERGNAKGVLHLRCGRSAGGTHDTREPTFAQGVRVARSHKSLAPHVLCASAPVRETRSRNEVGGNSREEGKIGRSPSTLTSTLWTLR